MITIIVLLILAGVSIAMLTGNNGILTQAQRAKNETENAQAEEQDILNSYENYLYDATGDVKQVDDSNPGVLEGSGTEQEPFIINSIEDLIVFADNVTKGTNTYQDQYVELGLSLDFNSDKSYVNPNRENYYGYEGKLKDELTNGKGFQSIGVTDLNETEKQFYGFFDGNNCVIKNLFINNVYTINESGVGFFSYNYGTIKNIGLENININVEFKPAISNSTTCFIGGLVGRNEGNISNVYTKGNIHSIATGENNFRKIRTGGICGQITSGRVENSYNTAQIITEGNLYESTIGGCVGTLSTDAVLLNSYNTGIVRQYNNSDIIVGGIVGHISQASATLTNCYYLYGTCEQGIGHREGTADDEENIVKSSDYMKSNEFLSLLNQDNSGMWKFSSGKNNGYPILYWQ